MTWRQAAIAVAVLVVVVVVAAAVVTRRSAPTGEPAPPTAEGAATAVETDGESVEVRLFFPGSGGWLLAEDRSVAAAEAGPDLRAIADAVLAGPESPGLYAPFPADTRVGSVFVSAGGVAYVDLISTSANPPSSGSRDEMLSVYSLINSVHANLPDLAGVVLLWNGQQRPTFAGHLDTGRPLTQNRSLVARR